jgi:hypothetical protein
MFLCLEVELHNLDIQLLNCYQHALPISTFVDILIEFISDILY